MNLLKLSTARNVLAFMTDATDMISGKTGLTLTITASKDGAAFASISPTVTELGNGWYSLALTASHTDTLGDLGLYITGTAANPLSMPCQVIPDLPGSISSANIDAIVDAVWDEVLTSATHNVSNSAAKRLRVFSGLTQTDSTVNDVAATTTSFVTALTSSVNDFYRDQLLVFSNGALAGQARPILSYNGATKVVTFDEAFTSAPANNDAFTLQSTHIHSVTTLVSSVWAKATSALDTVGSIGKLLVDRIDAVLSTRLAAADYTAPSNADVAAIKAKTDNLPASPASEGNVTAVGAAVDAVRDLVAAIPTNPLLTNDARLDLLDAAITSRSTPTFKRGENALLIFPMVDVNGDLATGLTVVAQKTVDGAAIALCTGSAVEVGGGLYKIALDGATDLDGATIAFKFSATGARPMVYTAVTEP